MLDTRITGYSIVMNAAEACFWTIVHVGRRLGGIPPRRYTNHLARRLFTSPPTGDELRPWSDRWGSRFALHPYYHLDQQVICYGCYEPRLHRWLEQRVGSGDVFMDVGANMGIVSLHAARLVGDSGRVHAFEPVPYVVERLKRNVALNAHGSRVEIHPCVLSDTKGSLTMTVGSGTEVNQGRGSIVNAEAGGTTIDVATLTLDEFVTSRGLERLDWIKLDTQGAEPLILAGGRATLARFRPTIISEVSPEDLRALGHDGRSYLRLLDEMGYQARSLERSGRPGDPIDPTSADPDRTISGVVFEPVRG